MNTIITKFSKEWHSLKKFVALNIGILWKFEILFAILFAILLRFWNTFCNTFCNAFAILGNIAINVATLWNFAIPKYCNTYCNTIAIQYYWNHPWFLLVSHYAYFERACSRWYMMNKLQIWWRILRWIEWYFINSYKYISSVAPW